MTNEEVERLKRLCKGKVIETVDVSRTGQQNEMSGIIFRFTNGMRVALDIDSN